MSDSLDLTFDLTMINLKGIPCSLNCYFGLVGQGAIRDQNKDFHCANGLVATGRDFIPTSDEEVMRDFTVTIPWSELHLPPGSHHVSISALIMRPVLRTRLARQTIHMQVLIR